jgi:hypothetical protein
MSYKTEKRTYLRKFKGIRFLGNVNRNRRLSCYRAVWENGKIWSANRCASLSDGP